MATIARGVDQPPSTRFATERAEQESHARALAARARSLWAQLKRPEVGLDLMRIYLGAGLTARGVLLLTSPELLGHVLTSSGQWASTFLIAHAVALVHLTGGLLLMLGCCTRVAAAIQIPPLAAAVFLLHLREGLLTRGQSLEFAALVLAMLVIFALCGAGPVSVDRVLMRPAQNEPPPLASAPPLASEARFAEEARPAPEHVALTAATEAVEEEGTPPLSRALKWRLAYLMAGATLFVALLGIHQFAAAAALLVVGFVGLAIWSIGSPIDR